MIKTRKSINMKFLAYHGTGKHNAYYDKKKYNNAKKA